MKFIALSAVITATTSAVAVATDPSGVINSPHLIHDHAHPLTAKSRYPTHHFELYVGGRGIKQLTIKIPPGIRGIREVELFDQNQLPVQANVSIQTKQVIIAFANAVPPKTILSVYFKGVKKLSLTPRIWLYPISAQMAGLRPVDIPIGIARIETYD